MNYYILGVVFGIIIAVGAALIVYWKAKKANPNMNKYDERQTVGRGKAFQAGFFSLLLANAAVSIGDYAFGLPGESFLWHVGAMFFGVCVFVLTAIHYDAYVGMYDSPKRFIRAGILFSIAMTLGAITGFTSDRPESRAIAVIDLMLVVMWLLVIIALQLHSKKAEAEE